MPDDTTNKEDALGETTAVPAPMPESEHEDQRSHRLAKIESLRAEGRDPYPVRYERTHTAGGIRAAHEGLAPGSETEDRVRVAGRLMLLRRQGKLSFATLADRDGQIQLFVSTGKVDEVAHHEFDHLDRGDWIGVEGTVMTTRRGELSIAVDQFTLLAKAVRPLPDKWHGLTDTDTRFRQRYVDLVMNEEAKRVALIRIKTISRIRKFLDGRDFLEVDGPVLQTSQGGATARPFITHHNALNLDMYLRIALELHLKRLIVGGLDRVFEIGRVFRNEGTDTTHNPEFTMLEAYQALGDYNDMMELTESLIVEVARPVLPDLKVKYGDYDLDFTPPFRRATMSALIEEELGVHLDPSMSVDEARAVLDGLHVGYEADWGSGKLMNAVYDELLQGKIIQPTFVLDHPRECSPLARKHRDDPLLAERFELVVAGHELANAYSELNDPIDQLVQFEAEASAKAGGNLEAGDVDLDYVRALEYGMPPTGGVGIGIDRLVMYLTGTPSIREVILFPTLRPEPGMVGVTEAGGHARAASDAGEEPPEMAATVAALVTAPPPLPRPSRTPVRVISWIFGVGGLLSMMAVVPFFHRGTQLFRDDVLSAGKRPTGTVAVVLIGMFMLLLADQLVRGKHRAWQLGIALAAAGLVVHVLRGGLLVGPAYFGMLLVLLVIYRDQFRAPSDPPSALRLLSIVPKYLFGVYAFGMLTLFVERGKITPDLTVGGMLSTISLGLVGVSGPYEFASRRFDIFFGASLLALGVLGGVGLLFLLLRPLTVRDPHVAEEWSAAESLVRRYGWDTLAYFSLRSDKSFFFASDGEAMIAYTFLGGCGLVSGDPIGRPESIPLVVDEFLAFCSERAWKPAFLAVRESDLPLYSSRGMHSFYLGDEAIVRCDRFDLDHLGKKSVREAVRRVGREYSFRVFAESKASPNLIRDLNAISERWRGKNPERGFTMSLSQDVKGDNPEFLLCVALDHEGKPGGFLRIVPAYGKDFGYTLDLMRHDPDSPNGMTEFLIAGAAEALKERGVARLSMNFAAWGRLLDPDIQHGPMSRIAAWFIAKLNPFFQIETLRNFNAKFEPDWLPRCIVFAEARDLARVGLLYVGLEGFLSMPLLGPLFAPRVVGGTPAPDEIVVHSDAGADVA